MKVPLGFTSTKTNRKSLQTCKGIIGLKQSPRAWFQRFTKDMNDIRYKRSQGDKILLVKTFNFRGRGGTTCSCG